MIYKKFFKSILASFKNKLRSQNIIDGTLELGELSSASGLNLNGELRTGERCILSNININGNVKIGRNTTIWGPNINFYGEVEIGSFCSIANNVSFFEKTHNYKRVTSYLIHKNFYQTESNEIISKGTIRIGSDVWVGTGVSVLSGVKIGHGVVVAANSIVNCDLPPYAICAGSPAKVIKYRFDDQSISMLLNLKWWEWENSKLIENKSFFEGELDVEVLKTLILNDSKI